MVTNQKGYMRKWYKKQRDIIIAQKSGKCEACGSKQQLEIHHIKPLNGNRPNGRLERLYEWKNNLDNITVLCHDCHCATHGMELWYER